MYLTDYQQSVIRAGWMGSVHPETIAKMAGLPPDEVISYLKSAGLLAQKTDAVGLPDGFTRFTKVVRKSGAIMALHSAGMSLAGICRSLGVDRKSVRCVLRSQGAAPKRGVTSNMSRAYTADDYQKEAARTINEDLLDDEKKMHAVLGLTSEAGEVAGLVQKKYQGHDIDIEHMKKELGDMLWFAAELCTANGWSLTDIMRMNISKLRARFPDGFDADRDAHRAEGDV